MRLVLILIFIVIAIVIVIVIGSCRAGIAEEVVGVVAEDGSCIGHGGRQDSGAGVDGAGISDSQSVQPRLSAGDDQEEGPATATTAHPRSVACRTFRGNFV